MNNMPDLLSYGMSYALVGETTPQAGQIKQKKGEDYFIQINTYYVIFGRLTWLNTVQKKKNPILWNKTLSLICRPRPLPPLNVVLWFNSMVINSPLALILPFGDNLFLNLNFENKQITYMYFFMVRKGPGGWRTGSGHSANIRKNLRCAIFAFNGRKKPPKNGLAPPSIGPFPLMDETPLNLITTLQGCFAAIQLPNLPNYPLGRGGGVT